MGQFGTITYVFLRLLLASLFFIALYTLDRQPLWPTSRPLWKHGIVLGIIATAVPMLSFNAALNYLSSGVTAVFRATEPIFIVILAYFFLIGESITKVKIFGIAFALAGALLLTFRGESDLSDVAVANPLGYLFATLALLAGSVSTVYARKYAQAFLPIDITSIQMVVGTAVLSLFVLGQGGIDLTGVERGRHVHPLYVYQKLCEKTAKSL